MQPVTEGVAAFQGARVAASSAHTLHFLDRSPPVCKKLVQNQSILLTHLILITILCGGCYYYLHFAVEKNGSTERLRNLPKVTQHKCIKSDSIAPDHVLTTMQYCFYLLYSSTAPTHKPLLQAKKYCSNMENELSGLDLLREGMSL